jgi:hypothetical protein
MWMVLAGALAGQPTQAWPAEAMQTHRPDDVRGVEGAAKAANAQGLVVGERPVDLSGTYTVAGNGQVWSGATVQRERTPIPGVYDVTTTAFRAPDASGAAQQRVVTASLEVIGEQRLCRYLVSVETSFASAAMPVVTPKPELCLPVAWATPLLIVGGVAQHRTTGPTPDAGVAIQACMHWSGEEPYNKARAKEIAKNVETLCPVALASLRDQYESVRNHPATAAAAVDLLQHLSVEPPGPMTSLCDTAATHHAALLAAGETLYEPYFAMGCPSQAVKLCGETKCQ